MLEDILSLIGMVFSIALICFLAYFVTKKLGVTSLPNMQNQGGKKMRVCERLALSANKSVVLVKIGDEFFVIGVSNENLSLIAKLDKEQTKDWTDMNNKTESSFADIFSQMIQSKNKKM